MDGRRFFVYILASKKHGTLYIGMSGNLPERIEQHRLDAIPGFTKKYDVKRLVYFEECADAPSAFLREKQMKKWNRDWKIQLIEERNPDWADLSSLLQF